MPEIWGSKTLKSLQYINYRRQLLRIKRNLAETIEKMFSEEYNLPFGKEGILSRLFVILKEVFPDDSDNVYTHLQIDFPQSKLSDSFEIRPLNLFTFLFLNGVFVHPDVLGDSKEYVDELGVKFLIKDKGPCLLIPRSLEFIVVNISLSIDETLEVDDFDWFK